MISRWQFRKIRPGDTASDPDFARTLFSGDATRSLVRESIQNSLDAGITDNGCVTVRFTLRSGNLAANAAATAPFIDGLWEHIHAESAGLEQPPSPSEKVPYLVVEDFGTRGLTGDPEAWSPFESEKNAFFLFFRALGRSGKKNEERGRWGVGKFVFPLASRAHCLFGYTVPSDTRDKLLMGRTVLKIHQTNGVAFHPDGHWGNRDSEEGLILPSGRAEVLREFCEVFNLRRRDEPGLSVVVPWLSVSLNGASITEAVVAEYFLPILRSELIVEVDDNGTVKVIDAETIVLVAGSISSTELRARIDLAVEAATWPAETMIVLPTIDPFGDTEWSERLQLDEKESLLKSLNEGIPIAVRVPLTLRPKEKSATLTWFDVFIQRVDGAGRTRPLIVREGITISEDKTQAIQDHISLVVVDHGPLAGFVGDAETPAHTTLQYDLVASKYTLAGKILKILRNAASEILRSLEQAADTDDFALLSEFFPVTKDDDLGRQKMPRPGGGNPVPPPVPPIPKRSPRYRVVQTVGGFRVTGTEEGTLPPLLTIRFAYQVRRGNPFARYNPLDFSLLKRDLQVEAVSVIVVDRTDNALFVTPTGSGFQVDISGFDPLRDIIVRVDAPPSEEVS